MVKVFIFIFCVFLIVGCGSDSSSKVTATEEQEDEEDLEQENTVYLSNVMKIIGNNCSNCHGLPTANGAPMSLVSYDDIVESADLINTRINLPESDPLSMPQGGASLSQKDKDTIDAWIKAGMPNN